MKVVIAIEEEGSKKPADMLHFDLEHLPSKGDIICISRQGDGTDTEDVEVKQVSHFLDHPSEKGKYNDWDALGTTTSIWIECVRCKSDDNLAQKFVPGSEPKYTK